MNSTSPSPVAINSTTVPSPSPVAINSTTVPSPVAPSPVTPAAVPSPSSVTPAAVPSSSVVLPSPSSTPSVPSSSTTPSVPSSNFPAISPSSVQIGSPFADDILLFFLVALLISVCLRWVCRTRTNKAAQYNRIDDPFDVETELIGVKTQYVPEIPEPELPEENTV